MNDWISLIISLPTENASVRMRAWRALKASGAVVLRDGVYLMPDRERCRTVLEAIAVDVREGGGTALALRVEEPDGANFESLFDRSEGYAGLLTELMQLQDGLAVATVSVTLKQVRTLRKTFANLVEIDFFPGESQRQVDTSLREMELACARTLAPDEPHPVDGVIARLQSTDFQGRIWATRQRPWVDRLASAWLIRRFIDPHARFLWLESPRDCPADVLGFDFDGATFSHVGSRVTFETLVASFAWEHSALSRLGLLVHYLDVGGIQPPEAAGVESVLAGLRDSITDDDELLTSAQVVFDGLFATFDKGLATP